jgi:hypothetical protein
VARFRFVVEIRLSLAFGYLGGMFGHSHANWKVKLVFSGTVAVY